MFVGFDTVGRKLLWGIAVPGLLVAVAGVGFFWHHAQEAVRETTREDALAIAEIVQSTFTHADAAGEPAHRAVSELMQLDARLLRSVVHLRVITPDGEIRWSRDANEPGLGHPERARIFGAKVEAVREEGAGSEVLLPLGGPACETCHSGRAQSLGVLQMNLGEPVLQRQVREVFRIALGSVLLFAVALAIATGLSLHFFLTRPLARLNLTMRRAESGNFLVRAEDRGRDEFARLGSAFNEVLVRLTAMKAEEIDTHRDLQEAKEKLALREALERRLTELSLLFDVARSLNSTLELPEVFARISALVAQRLHIPEFSLMLLGRDGLLEVKSSYPPKRRLEGVTFRVGEGASGRAAQTLKAVYLPDVQDVASPFQSRGMGGASSRAPSSACPSSTRVSCSESRTSSARRWRVFRPRSWSSSPPSRTRPPWR